MDSGRPHRFDPDSVERARAVQLTAEQAERLSAVLAPIGDPVRLRVIAALLAVEELRVGDVVLATHVNHDAASYRAPSAPEARLAETRRQGRLNYYRLEDHGVQGPLGQHWTPFFN